MRGGGAVCTRGNVRILGNADMCPGPLDSIADFTFATARAYPNYLDGPMVDIGRISGKPLKAVNRGRKQRPRSLMTMLRTTQKLLRPIDRNSFIETYSEY